MTEAISAPTPGPWTAENWSCHAPTTVLAQARGKTLATHRVIAECAGPDSLTENVANARLIAAAPELLAALRGYMACGHGGRPDLDAAYKAAFAAIAKAEGAP